MISRALTRPLLDELDESKMNPQMAPRSLEQVIPGASAGAPLDAPDHVLTWNVNAKDKDAEKTAI